MEKKNEILWSKKAKKALQTGTVVFILFSVLDKVVRKPWNNFLIKLKVRCDKFKAENTTGTAQTHYLLDPLIRAKWQGSYLKWLNKKRSVTIIYGSFPYYKLVSDFAWFCFKTGIFLVPSTQQTWSNLEIDYNKISFKKINM